MAVSEQRRSVRARERRLASALDRRLPVSSAGREFLRKAFWDHWTLLLGELALYSLLLVLTGVWLTLFFIGFDVRVDPLAGQLRRWAAPVFAAAIGVHLLRVFFTGAFRRPREVNSLRFDGPAAATRGRTPLLSREDAYRLVHDTPRPRAEATEAWWGGSADTGWPSCGRRRARYPRRARSDE